MHSLLRDGSSMPAKLSLSGLMAFEWTLFPG